MNILNGIYAGICLLSIVGSSMVLFEYAIGRPEGLIVDICNVLFVFGPVGLVLVTFIPLGPIAWLVGLISYLVHFRNEDYRKCVGRKWVWLIIWPFVFALLWAGAVFALVYFTGGV